MSHGGGPTVVAVGLGPAGADLCPPAVRDVLSAGGPLYLRTRTHPAAAALGAAATSFDDVYERAETIGEVYATIVEELVAAARSHGRVHYAVPGSPFVAEETVVRLRADDRVHVEVVPASSFLDLVWQRLGTDPVDAGVRLVDGHRFGSAAAGERGPLLVTQVDRPEVLEEVKLALLELRPAPSVTVLARLGSSDEVVSTVPCGELDRVPPDPRTCLWIPGATPPVAAEVAALVGLVRELRVGCPWDRAQDHRSLRRHLLEEAYECLEAIDGLDVDDPATYVDLEEELGDLLFQVVFHAVLAAEAGQFTLADVARGVHDKLHRRHPHVFGEAAGDGTAPGRARLDEVWEQQKREEKGRRSVFDGIPDALPALAAALKVQKKAAASPTSVEPPASAEPPVAAPPGGAAGDEEWRLGTRLFGLVDEARRAGVDPESALRQVVADYRARARAAELDGSGARGRAGDVDEVPGPSR